MAILFGLVFYFLQALQITPQYSLLNSNDQNFDRYNFNKLTTRIIQSETGLIWIGTQDGVLSFNGYEAKEYSRSLLDSTKQYFVGDYVSAILEDSNHNIWVSVNAGSWNVLPFGEDRFINFMDVSDNSEFQGKESLVELDDGRILANSDLGLHLLSYNSVLRKKSYELITLQEMGRDRKFNKLFKGDDGKIYGLSDGLYEISISNNNQVSIDLIVEGEYSWHFYKIDDDKFFFTDRSDQKNALILYKKGEPKKEFILPFLNTENRRSQSILRDSKGKFWLLSNQGVLSFILDENDEIQEKITYKLGNVRDIIEDKSGNIFFASSLGLLKLNWNYDQYSYISLPEELKNTYVFKFHTDIAGNYWIGHRNGLLKYDVQQKTFSNIEESGTGHSIAEDANNNIWIGDPTSLRIFDHKTGDLIHDFESDFTYAITFDANDNAWFVSRGVLSRVKSGSKEVERFQLDDHVQSIIFDEDNLWVNSRNGRNSYLRKYRIINNELVLVDTYLKGVLDFQINWIEDDQIGNLWLSTDKGVIVFNKGEGVITELLNREHKLEADGVFEIIRDQSGIIWVKASAVGSAAINPQSLEAVSFTPSWLAQPGSPGFFCVNAVGRAGELFTDGRGGFFVFHPDSLKRNPNVPDLALDAVFVNDSKNVEQVNSLSHNENDIEFNVTGIQFDNPDRNEYGYYLEGFDEDWNYAGEQRTAQYLSLPPGSYTFFVQASNSDKVWSEPIALASFRILPPWWANPIAYSFYVIVLGFIGYRFYQIQLNKKVAESEANRLKEVDEFKTRFFTNISHEFRTPLTVIMGLADRIEHDSSPVIKRNASKLLELINQILELSKVEANQASLKPEQFDFIKYVNYSVESLSTLANERGIGLSVKTEFDELFVELDQQKVDLILHNLLSNALKFTEKEGQVIVRVKKDPENLIFSVSDTGIGIKKEALAHIFNRFFQTDLDNHRYEGTGIGLALTNELVHLMNGNIIIESEIGAGSIFTVTIPCTFIESQAVVDHKTNKLIKTAQKITSPEDADVILLVEDNYDVRSFIKQILADEYKVLVAHNGDEGIKLATEEIPDIVLTDVMMPYKDGFEITEELKQDVRTSHIPIIMLTAKADVESRISGLKTGADVYLGKPFNEEELKAHIQNLISLRNSIQKRFSGEIKVQELGDTQEDEFLKKIHIVILENLDDDTFGIEEVCSALAVSRTQLHRKLKALTGKSTSIFIRDIRLVEAKNLLKTSQLSVSEIAYSVGFNDPNYFSKLYSDKFSHSPTKEREMVS